MEKSNELWIDKYKPKSVDDICGNKNIIKSLDNYVKSLKDNPNLIKNILISGPTGIGKTSTAHIVLTSNNYRVIEFNATNVEGIKTIKNTIQNSFYYKNVLEMFNQDKRTTAIIIDEFDALISMGSKGGINELLSVLRISKMAKNKKKKLKYQLYLHLKLLMKKN